MRSILILFILTLATPALAVDGVMEINQTCAVETGCFAGDLAGFPVTIGSAGSYRLTGNLLPDLNRTAIYITASDVGIDLNNFAIIGAGCVGATTRTCQTSSVGSGVEVDGISTRFGVSVQNGSITGMGAFGVRLGRQSEVTDLRVRWCMEGIFVVSYSTISRNVAYENFWHGITAGSGSVITENTAYDNGGFGFINLGLGGRISDNTAYSNGVTGITAAQGATISGNSSYENGGDGITAGSGSTISGNTAYGNTDDGILAREGSTVSGNTVRLNGGDGIDAFDGSSVQNNTANTNTGFGLNLRTANVVYHANVVTGNIGGTVNGGTARTHNFCDGAATPSCP